MKNWKKCKNRKTNLIKNQKTIRKDHFLKLASKEIRALKNKIKNQILETLVLDQFLIILSLLGDQGNHQDKIQSMVVDNNAIASIVKDIITINVKLFP